MTNIIVVVVAALVVIAAITIYMLKSVSHYKNQLSQVELQRERDAEQYENMLAQCKEQYRESLESVKENHERGVATIVEQHKVAIETINAQHQKVVDAMAQRHQQDMNDIKALNEKSLAQTNEQHKKDIDLMKEQFKSLAADVAADNSKLFREQSESGLNAILNPIKEKFAAFDKTMKDVQVTSAEQTTTLKSQIEQIMKQSDSVSQEARNLANALSARSKVQGDFGEMILKDILLNAGLEEGIQFVCQQVMTTAEGYEIKSEDQRTLIPDVQVYYPDGTVVIVDSKVSLTAFQRYTMATTLQEQNQYADEHVKSVINHIDELKKKDYTGQIPSDRRKVDYNIMFIPVEGAFSLMQDKAPTLWQTAKNQNVLIVSQKTLIIILNMIQMAWKHQEQEQNVEAIYKTASELMSVIAEWLKNFEKTGVDLENALKSYQVTRYKLTESNQSVVKKIKKLETLGAKQRKSLAKTKAAARLTSEQSVIPQALQDITEQD